METKKPVAFQGEPGAFSEVATLNIFGTSIPTSPTKSFADVFEKVKNGICEYGVLPVENTLGGIVYQVWDCLTEYDLEIIAETRLKINHCLIVNPGTKIDTIRKVYTHYQPLLQCAQFLKNHKDWVVEDAYDTAGSVHIIKNTKGRERTAVAAIASERAAQILGMEVLKKGIQDSQQNFTRFIIIRKKHKNPVMDGNKFTYVLSLEHNRGALLELMKILKKYKVNLTSIHSRPNKQKPFTYNFFIEGVFAHKPLPSLLRTFIADIKAKSKKPKLLGIYYSTSI